MKLAEQRQSQAFAADPAIAAALSKQPIGTSVPLTAADFHVIEDLLDDQERRAKQERPTVQTLNTRFTASDQFYDMSSDESSKQASDTTSQATNKTSTPVASASN